MQMSVMVELRIHGSYDKRTGVDVNGVILAQLGLHRPYFSSRLASISRRKSSTSSSNCSGPLTIKRP